MCLQVYHIQPFILTNRRGSGNSGATMNYQFSEWQDQNPGDFTSVAPGDFWKVSACGSIWQAHILLEYHELYCFLADTSEVW